MPGWSRNVLATIAVLGAAFLGYGGASTARSPGEAPGRPAEAGALIAAPDAHPEPPASPAPEPPADPAPPAEEPPEPARNPAPPSIEPGDGSCANPVIPEWKARAESGCRWDAYNPTGCGGRGCLGFYQLDEGHFAEVSPWNPSRPGGCVDLAATKWEPATQTECASRLGPSAWGL